MKQFSKYVGLDVHKETIAVAVAESDGAEVRYFGEIQHAGDYGEAGQTAEEGRGAVVVLLRGGSLRLRNSTAIERSGVGLSGGGAVADPEEGG